ncbi:hypothetical protein [Thiopseudomonas acetoxidans]|uniref:Uncharacterized protein n=1 Tax=Thiopseudomonas acetoxidans TaxID=3041622 RepID=A0ABT7SRL2_9GAMM|nr:hypothetical protein [Thiopseudomonas sp. CY1220]MDM7858828.1 hypothetical protein [Thiopseudomonas sp. CY1220]
MFSQICLLDDLFRDGFLESRKFIYSIIKEPIYQATGLVIPDLSEFPVCRGLKKEFSLGLFYSLCGNKSWHEVYNGVSEKAAEYLSESIPENTLIIGYEMPPWLLKLLSDNDLPYVSIRINPIKFCRDLYLVLDGNIETLKNAKYFNVDEKEVRLEAGFFLLLFSKGSYLEKNQNILRTQ